VEKGSAPFVVSLLLMILLICIYPEIVMWLPRIVG
jgi:TRAP-type C4-dicarboxylate transport system permease large subunit